MADSDVPQVHDPRVLRAFAHPLRARILAEVSARGSLRAADVAAELGVPANQASFHLRQLAKYGLVEEDPDAARDKRDRVWRVTSQEGVALSLGDLEKAPGGKALTAGFRRNAASWGRVVIDAVYAPDHDPDALVTLTETALRLTKDEAGEVSRAVNRVLEEARARHQREGGADADRRTYLYYGALLPHPDPPRGA